MSRKATNHADLPLPIRRRDCERQRIADRPYGLSGLVIY